MKEGYYIYNNEALASTVILAVIQKCKQMDIARVCLLLPFFLDDRTVSALNRNNNDDYLLETFISNNPKLFISFNKRYEELLPITINSVGILEKCKIISVSKTISIQSTLINDFGDIGERFLKIEKSVDYFLNLTNKYTTIQLYKFLKIQL